MSFKPKESSSEESVIIYYFNALSASLQITFSYKAVICQARDKV